MLELLQPIDSNVYAVQLGFSEIYQEQINMLNPQRKTLYTVLQITIMYTVQCNLDLVILLVTAKTVAKSHNVTKWNDFM